MNLSRSLSVIIISFFLYSCNAEKKNEETSTVAEDSTAIVTAIPESNSTITTTPQTMMVVRHKVADFAKWKLSFDEPRHDSMRLSGGMHSYMVGRGMTDSNMVIVAVKADDLEKAKTFGKSSELKSAMQKGGVISKPVASMITFTYMDTAQISSNMRSMIIFNVKDWSTWEKEFINGAQERIDNGIVTRAYGHDAEVDNKIIVVTAIIDSAKAVAYWKSDMLKNRRVKGGVIGEPERFNYRMVQRY